MGTPFLNVDLIPLWIFGAFFHLLAEGEKRIGGLRYPVFKGLQDDKRAEECVIS